MVFHRRGKTGFLNKLTNKWVEKKGNIHFYLNMECLRGRGGSITIDTRHLTTYDNVLNVMSEEHMQVLNEMEMLHLIVSKKYNLYKTGSKCMQKLDLAPKMRNGHMPYTFYGAKSILPC